jgi:hypothetical protein
MLSAVLSITQLSITQNSSQPNKHTSTQQESKQNTTQPTGLNPLRDPSTTRRFGHWLFISSSEEKIFEFGYLKKKWSLSVSLSTKPNCFFPFFCMRTKYFHTLLFAYPVRTQQKHTPECHSSNTGKYFPVFFMKA